MKRISLLLIVAVMLFGSRNAAACALCAFDVWTDEEFCRVASVGSVHCDFTSGVCEETGGSCPTLASADTARATQWTVVSVQRLDEQRTITSTVKTAQISSKPALKP